MECVLLVGGGLLLFFLLTMHERQAEKKRLHDMKQMAAELRLHFLAKKDATSYLSELPAFYLFSRGTDRQTQNMIWGMVDDRVTMTIFDYSYEDGGEESTSRVQQTVLLFHSTYLHLPFFSIRAKTFFHWLTGRAGYETVKFPRHRDRLFSSIYFVEGKKGHSAQGIFSLPLLSYCERNRLISIEGEEGCLLFYQPEKRVEPHDLPSFIENGRELLEIFLPQ